MLTWSQLGLHQKPIGLLNTNGFYKELLAFIDTMIQKGFLKQVNRDMLLVSDSIPDLLAKMQAYQAPVVEKWMDRGKT
jgi:hypothetical protein